MKDDEFAELGILGNRLNKSNEEIKIKKKESNFRFKKINSKFSFKKFLIIIFRKIVILFKCFITKFYNISKNLIIKIKHKLVEFNFKRRKNISYKIIELKKEKRNKVIIIRKRVPMNTIINKKIDLSKPSLYYCSIDSDEIKNYCTDIICHDKLKKSIWDFPIKR